jgi:hypothetical protein
MLGINTAWLAIIHSYRFHVEIGQGKGIITDLVEHKLDSPADTQQRIPNYLLPT